MKFVPFLERKKAHSLETFGPQSCKGVIKHIRKELIELEDKGCEDLGEWVDVILLALDGAWRTGASPEQVAQAILDKQAENEKRKWPDCKTVDKDEAIEHEQL